MTADSPTPRSRYWPLPLIGSLFFVALMSVIAWNVQLPYVAFSPGPVADAADSIVADEVDVYPPDGELLMLTIVAPNVNIFEAVLASLDPTLDLVRKEAVRREGESDEAYRNRVLQQMDDSNYRSVVVALQQLGIEMEPYEVVINEIVDGVPAQDVLELGDTIVAINGVPVSSVEELRPITNSASVGDEVTMTIVRAGSTLDVVVELAERTDEPGVAMIGVVPGELLRPPFPLSIQAGDVGGPSAGMMHTLAIIDTLTEGELTAGQVIAGTGTIQLDGSVGNIGGIRQKVVGAEAAGASYILVPEGNYVSALTAERSTIEIVPIGTIQDAIEFLQSLQAA